MMDLSLAYRHVPAIERALADPDAPPPMPGITIAEIASEIAAETGVTVLDLRSAHRARWISLPRDKAMWRCRMETPKSLSVIGNWFGDRHHTSVLAAVRRHAARIAEGTA